ncbi:MAG: hypothetical protein M1282_03355 [Chloroflexi bacterium]|nr:hypothetical protein [Chloroflexota bacterium]
MKRIELLAALLIVFASACTPRQIVTPLPTPLPESTAASTWEGLPIFPGAVEVKDNGIGYHYTISDTDILTVQRFYKDEAPAVGWELLQIADVCGADIGKAWLLLFTKGKTIAQVDIFTRDNTAHVVLHFD